MQNYINIANFTYPSELVVARSVLEANDISCYVRDELTVQVHNFYSNAIGGIRLEVPVSQLEEARAILTDSGYGSFLLKEQDGTPDKHKFYAYLKVAIYGAVVLGVLLIITILIVVYG